MAVSRTKGTQRTSNFRSVCTIVITSVGLGILELPSSVAKVGSINFGMLMLITGFASWWAIQLLHKCLAIGDGAYDSYASVAEAAYGLPGKVLVGMCMHVTLTGICACLLVLLGKTMEPLLPLPGSLVSWSRAFWVILGALVAQPFGWVQSMSKLGIVSAVGVAAVFILGGLIVVASTREIITQVERPVTPLINFGASELGFATVMLCFSFGSIPAIPSVFASMERPQDFRKVSTVAYLVISFITALVAYSGFFAWGDSITQRKDDDDILDIIAPIDRSSSTVKRRKLDWLGYSCLGVAVVVVLTHLVVLIRPVADAAEAATSNFFGTKSLRRCSRSIPSVLMLILGLAFKELSLIMLLVGSISVMLLTLVIPAVLFYKLHTLKNIPISRPGIFWIALSLLILGSGFASVIGVVTAVKHLTH